MNDMHTQAKPLQHFIAPLCDWLAGQESAMLACLEALVNQESNSYDKPGVDAAGRLIESWLVADGIECHWHPLPVSGDVLEASIGAGTESAVYLMGHRDTVFPKGTVDKRPFTREGNTGFGPGVADMKAGLVLNCFVLKGLQYLLRQAGLPQLPFPVKALFTGDEEIGSPESEQIIRAQVSGALAVFNAEPGRISGNVVSARKGGASFAINVLGKAAHSGVNPADGASAIAVLAQIITALHALTDYQQGVTTNVGLISGGMSSNTVAAEASAKLDLRFVTESQRNQAFKQIQAIVSQEYLPGVTATLTLMSVFNPLEAHMSEALLKHYQHQAEQVGFKVDGEFTGGCSDAGLTASMGVPTLCGTGPVGARMHTDGELCRLETLVPRAQAVACSVLLLNPKQLQVAD